MIDRDPNALAPQLAVRHISGRDTCIQIRSFRKKLPSLYSTHECPKQTNLMTHFSSNAWHSWCHTQGEHPFSGPITRVVNFMADLYKEGLGCNSLNMYRSAISLAHEKMDGFSVGQHPVITRLMKGVFHNRPLLPKYSSTWSVQSVVDCIISMGGNEQISLKHRTLKTTILLFIDTPLQNS